MKYPLMSLMSMGVSAVLTLEFDSVSEASRIYDALQVDDDGYVEQKLNGSTIVVTAKASTPGKLREALEDYLSCLTAAQGSLNSLAPGLNE